MELKSNHWFIISLRLIWFLILGYFALLMLQITSNYWGFRTDVAFALYKFEEMDLAYYRVAFFSHVFSSVLVLVAGIVQFSTWVRVRFPIIHRKIGILYVTTILLISAPSGFIMAIHANGGIPSKISFALQALLWLFFTWSAFRSALQKNWEKHRAMMIRSFALTLSAVSLRAFKWLIVHIWGLPPMDTYQIVAWLGWGVNFVIAEIVISIGKRKTVLE